MARKTPTRLQERYVKFFDGNHTDACRKAGYACPESAARVNKKLPHLQQAIKARENNTHYVKKGIATRKQRQKFWSDTMWDENEAVSNRLRASELLGKSEADFIERVEHSVGPNEIDAMIALELQRLSLGMQQLPHTPVLPEKTQTEENERDEIIDLVENQVIYDIGNKNE